MDAPDFLGIIRLTSQIRAVLLMEIVLALLVLVAKGVIQYMCIHRLIINRGLALPQRHTQEETPSCNPIVSFSGIA